MKLGRSFVVLAAGLVAAAGCGRRQTAEVNDIVPRFEVNRAQAPLGSAVEITYTWQLEPTAKKLAQDHRAFVHFVDSHGVMLFEDDHTPVPPVTEWEPGKSYSYQRTKFIPVYPYVGDVDVRMGLAPVGKGERVMLKGEDAGLREFKVARIELLPQTENIFLVYKEGWHNPESSPQNPSLERTWTKKDALISFKNPKKDVVVYVEADTNAKAFTAPPVLTLAVNNKTGVTIPIPNSEVFLKKVRVKAADLGPDEWVDLRLSMSESFVPKLKGVNTHDDRELGLMVYHLYVAEADKLGTLKDVVDAGPVTVGPMTASAASPAPGAAPGAKASPAPKAGTAKTGAAARPSAAKPSPAASPRS
jgi:hypothetical protein